MASQVPFKDTHLRHAKPLLSPDSPAPLNLVTACTQALNYEAYSAGKVPIRWQTALVSPVFKHGDASDTANYRPTAIGAPLYRLYAKFLNRQLTRHTEQQRLCPPTQTGC